MNSNKLFMLLLILIISISIFFFFYNSSFGNSEFIKTTISFGRTFINQSELTYDNWKIFIDDIVINFFPEGLTIFQSEGHILDGNKIQKNKNFDLFIVHKNNVINKEKIEKIIQIFRKKYNNELQVMKIQENVLVDFYTRS